MSAGGTHQLVATAGFSDGANQDVTADAAWSSDAELVATVSATGLVEAVGAGTATISAVFGGQTGTTGMTVAPPGFFVDDNAAGANDGSSWTDAFTTVQAAMAVAIAGQQVWVAAGAYTPSAANETRACHGGWG